MQIEIVALLIATMLVQPVIAIMLRRSRSVRRLEYPDRDKLKNDEKRKNDDYYVGGYMETPDGEMAEIVGDDHAALDFEKPKRGRPINLDLDVVKPKSDDAWYTWYAKKYFGLKPEEPKLTDSNLSSAYKPSYENAFVNAYKKGYQKGVRRAMRSAEDMTFDEERFIPVAIDKEKYNISIAQLVWMRKLLGKGYPYHWYTTRMAMDQFCRINGISRRNDQHFSNDAVVAPHDSLAYYQLTEDMDVELLREWITSSDLRGASDWPTSLLHMDIRYVTGLTLPYKISERQNSEYPFLFLLVDTKNNIAVGITCKGQAYRFNISADALNSIPYETDIDGNPAHNGVRYEFPVVVATAHDTAAFENQPNLPDLIDSTETVDLTLLDLMQSKEYSDKNSS